MIKNKANLNNFTPVTINPEVLVLHVKSSTISKVSIPLEQTKLKLNLKLDGK
jgi:hypothetical protein